MNKVLILDDHPLLLLQLQRGVVRDYPQAQVSCWRSGQVLRQQLRQGAMFDAALLDLELADDDGFALLALLKQLNPLTLLMPMSATERPGDVTRALDLGAGGFLPKRQLSLDALMDAVAFMRDGGIFVPRTTPQVLPDGRVNDAKYQTLTDMSGLGLTPRQADVLSLIVDGKNNKEIAQITGIALDTVKDHVSAILRTLNVEKRSEVVSAVARLQNLKRQKTHLPSGGVARIASLAAERGLNSGGSGLSGRIG
jgi:DNA-binding NarL/FixJ family response regulator